MLTPEAYGRLMKLLPKLAALRHGIRVETPAEFLAGLKKKQG